MRLFFLRHAPTPGNLQRKYIGSTDEYLSEEGIYLAQKAPDLAVSQVFTSALRRTRQTAALLYPRAKIIPIPDLNEMHFGAFEGRSYQDMEHDAAYRAWVNAGCEPACPGGEKKAAFTKRCVSAFLKLLPQKTDNPPDLYFVLHDGTLKAILSCLATPEKPYFDWQTPFCGGYCFTLRPGTGAVKTAVPPAPENRCLVLLQTIPAPL